LTKSEQTNVITLYKYSMYDLICDVLSCCVWGCDTGKINASDKIIYENQKKEK